ncbi:MAG: hypothetical protein RR854_09235 [Muribaculaceae bacterium]
MRTLTTHRQAKERRRRSTSPTHISHLTSHISQLTTHRQAKERRRRSTSERQF